MGKDMSKLALIFSLLFFIPVLPMVGMVLGIIALAKGHDDPDAKTGYAIAAIAVGFFMTIFGIGFMLGFLRGMGVI